MKPSEDAMQKKPSGIAIVIGGGKGDSAPMPGAALDKGFLGENFGKMKEGATGTITLRYKVNSVNDDMVDLDFESCESCSPAGGESEGDMSSEGEDDDMGERFKKFSSGKDKDEAEYDGM